MDLKRRLLPLLLLGLCSSTAFSAVTLSSWSPAAIGGLKRWVQAAPADSLPVLATTDLDRALASGNEAEIDRAATELAIRLARLHLLGSASPAERKSWHIIDTDGQIDMAGRLEQALMSGASGSGSGIDGFFEELKPHFPDYPVLRAALAREKDPARRATLALNMERWRWMPLSPGPNYLLVNAAAFEVGLWRNGQRVGAWPVIVGKQRTPTPVFAATVTGVTFNPWWDVPSNIVRESVGSLVRRNPKLARQRGYVWGNGRYRQRPGAGNALGQMKLAMPNAYNVYLHDTPDKKLFAQSVRAFSHGCIRVGNALDLAATLLQGVKSGDEMNAIVASGETRTVALAAQLPVYITYFTAVANSDGTVRVLPDIYGRDVTQYKESVTSCAA